MYIYIGIYTHISLSLCLYLYTYSDTCIYIYTSQAEDGEKDPKRRKLSPENGEKGAETKDEVLRLA